MSFLKHQKIGGTQATFTHSQERKVCVSRMQTHGCVQTCTHLFFLIASAQECQTQEQFLPPDGALFPVKQQT